MHCSTKVVEELTSAGLVKSLIGDCLELQHSRLGDAMSGLSCSADVW